MLSVKPTSGVDTKSSNEFDDLKSITSLFPSAGKKRGFVCSAKKCLDKHKTADKLPFFLLSWS